MGTRVRTVLAAGSMILAACTAGDAEATSTTQLVTTSTHAMEPFEVCSAQSRTALAPGALSSQSIVADIDGDGFEDIVTGFLLGSSDATEANAAVIHVELASGWGTDLRIDQLGLAEGTARAEPRTVVTIGGDRLVVVGVGGIAAGQLYAFFVFEDCGLRVVTTTDGELPDFWVGGGRTHDDWFVCETDQVLMVQLGTSNPDAEPKMYGAGAAQTYRYAEGEFVRIRSSDIDVALPATRDAMTRIYPPCVG